MIVHISKARDTTKKLQFKTIRNNIKPKYSQVSIKRASSFDKDLRVTTTGKT